jgi:outer membrane protein TolC
LLQKRFNLKNVLLSARNVYWSIVTSTQIVRLQTENVARALKLRDYMNNRTRLRLFDDTDAMQAQAAFDTRELELQSSLDQREVMLRQFNTLRGVEADTAPELEPLPTHTLMMDVRKDQSTHMSREDFNMLRAQAKGGLAQAKVSQSQIKPLVDVVASFATNGRDGLTAQSYAQAESVSRYPTWSVGVNLVVPLDFGLVRELNRGYRAAESAATELNAQAQFSETRAWEDLLKQKSEAQGRFDRALRIEKIQTQLVQREKLRLLNGRATTFETITFEQNLALAQIQRVRAELDLMQIHNVIKTFEAQP